MNLKDTIFLPTTGFQMKGNLSVKEPELLVHWDTSNLYARQRARLKGRPKFCLHDGPPFANGAPHVGHALNKVIKDIVIRFKQMSGYDAPLILGWDCHGLPIEWKIEQKLKEEGRSRDMVSAVEFRDMCHDFANHWINIQREGFKRLGLTADWDNPYLTMDKFSEATVVRQVGKFIVDGTLYQGEKPVLWSVVEQTALADAEVEYMDKKSTSIYVAFQVKSTPVEFLSDAYCVIWTTTPWTIPGNRAICYAGDSIYCLLNANGKRILIAKDLVEDFCKTTSIEVELIREFSSDLLKDMICNHPFKGKGYDFDVPLLEGVHVEITTGTGFVHTAPGHGLDDFKACKAHNIPVPRTVNEGGIYYGSVPLFAGKHIFKVEPDILCLLDEVGALLHQGVITHSYPHSWRSKAPLIFRVTPQWFISMDDTGLREKALEKVDQVQWIPPQGYNRIRSFIENRGDWCLSRQRVWGVPLPLFVHKETGEPIRDPAVIERVAQIFEREGADAWFKKSVHELLGDNYDAGQYSKVMDTLDVWFESSSTYAYVLRKDDPTALADIYIEGSDQHRGWFQHSLLNCCGTYGDSPFKAVMTHGFIVDEEGRKMSKSIGNVITLQDIISQLGADIFRIWVASSDFTQDLKLGNNVLKQLQDVYRKLRNTLRYLLGGLSGYEPQELSRDQLPELERWMLHRLTEMHEQLMEHVNNYDINRYFNLLHLFCSNDLSSFFFDIRKDCLYCDGEDDPKRIAYRYTLNHVFEYLIRWLAPILVFTSEEAWRERHGQSDADTSVHLQDFLVPPEEWKDDELNKLFVEVRSARRVMTAALEIARRDRLVGSSLQAKVIVFDPKGFLPVQRTDFWAEIAITSEVEIRNEPIPEHAFCLAEVPIGVHIVVAEGEKCERCWQIVKDLNEDKLCTRCRKVLGH